MSSVVPVLTHEYELLSERYLEGQLLMVGPRLKTGMPIRMDNPHEVGADRLVNALAAYERIGTTCIAVDFGTAVNYDVVSSDGEYLGGVLAPGVEVSLDALAERAARLFKVDLESPKSTIGRSTYAALQSGLVYGFAGPGRRHPRPHPRGAGRGGDGRRDRRPRGDHRAALRPHRRGRRPA